MPTCVVSKSVPLLRISFSSIYILYSLISVDGSGSVIDWTIVVIILMSMVYVVISIVAIKIIIESLTEIGNTSLSNGIDKHIMFLLSICTLVAVFTNNLS